MRSTYLKTTLCHQSAPGNSGPKETVDPPSRKLGTTEKPRTGDDATPAVKPAPGRPTGQRARARSLLAPLRLRAGRDGLCALDTGTLGVSPLLQGGEATLLAQRVDAPLTVTLGSAVGLRAQALVDVAFALQALTLEIST